MKTRLFQILGVAAIATLGLASCETDPCDGVECGTNGDCLEGECVCADGFGGEDCATDYCEALVCDATGGVKTGTSGGCDCVCNDYYEGDDCSETFSAKFVKQAAAVSDEVFIQGSTTPTTLTYELTIAADGPGGLTINNLSDYGTTIDAMVDASNTLRFTFNDTDAQDRDFEGEGVINAAGTEIVIDYTVTFTDNTSDTGQATVTL